MTHEPTFAMQIEPEDCLPGHLYEVTYRGSVNVVARRDYPGTALPWRIASPHPHGMPDALVSNPVRLVTVAEASAALTEQVTTLVESLLPNAQKERADRAEEKCGDMRRERDAALAQAAGVTQEGHDAISFLSNALRDAIYQAGDGALPLERGYPWHDALHEYAPDALAGLVDRGARALAHIAFDHDAWPDLSEDSRETFRRLDRAGITVKDGEGHV